MDFYLLGNGFDLYHRLPTKYINFLHTVDFLVNHYEDSMDTVGKIFGDARLQKCDPWIRICYETHRTAFDNTQMIPTDIWHLIEIAKNNLWYDYLMKSYNQDLGWIDFEKEVSRVIDAFSGFFKKYSHRQRLDAKVTFDKMEKAEAYIVQRFPFFLEWCSVSVSSSPTGNQVKADYVIEVPLGSKCYQLNKELIAEKLFSSLTELGIMLRDYLKHFVDEMIIFDFPIESSANPPFSKPSPAFTITFNYTNIYEKIFRKQEGVCHIHGNLDTNIVLGTNPTEEDDGINVDTTFLRFKKYYQRVLNRSDDDYLQMIADLERWKSKGHNKLTVFGHSLDRTDEDIIRECFEASTDITVYYYEPDFNSTVRNLIAIFGKTEFDRLRREKNLNFKPQPMIDWGAH